MNYPRIACYAANRSWGKPFLTGYNSPDMAVIKALARYPTVTLDVTPWYSAKGASRYDVPLLLRRENPRIRILAYQLLGWWYLPPTVPVYDTDLSWAGGTWHRALRETDGFGAQSGSGWMVRWDKPETEERLTQALCSLASSRMFDGLFGDYFWTRSSLGVDAMQRMIHRARQAGGSGFLVLGNGSAAESLDTDGGFREGFPDLLENTFDVVRKWRAARPHRSWDWLQAGDGLPSLESEEAKRAARFALGTACLFDMMCSVGPGRDQSVEPPYATWWLPEYDGGGRGVGWLGEPMGPATPFGPKLWMRDFAGGRVYVNPSADEDWAGAVGGLEPISESSLAHRVRPRDAVFLRRVM